MQAESLDSWRRDLERVRGRLEGWRRGRPRGARIPAVLWRAAVALARRHGVSKTSLALHLDYYALQRRLAEPEPRRQRQEAGFVEVTLPWSVGGARCQVELCDPGGRQVRVDLAGLSAAELAAFVRAVCGREP
jgi:hypothetical protein